MGADKARLVVAGETLAARAARVLAEVCDPVLEVGPGVSGLAAVREDPPGAGPLAALVAGADAAGRAPVLLLGCDHPFVEAPLLRLLAGWPGAGSVVPLADGRPQYLCARYGPTSLDAARRLLAAGHAALRDLEGAGDVDYVREVRWRAVAPPHALADVDHPADLDRYGLPRPEPAPGA